MPKPLLFLTGFLGAGKTTLLRALLNEYRESGRSADVILNDFENAELDASTLPPGAAPIAPIAPIAPSCACCACC
ncbi:MAG: CobW-like GTP-binding protein, partial [Verrucomicrobiales bacterium]|nr:CobW-like GTP-binding protein [Verrucomicrobiales bacterium]